MEYKNLGNFGVKISSLGLGTMTFGDGADEAMSAEIYAMARDHGINYFDCADVYVKGVSEQILGHLIKKDRDRVMVATKSYFRMGDDINDRGLSRFHVTKAVETSLKNLDTDYIDVYYLHGFDAETPLEETLAILSDLVQQGKILYIGLSNFAAWQVMKALEIAKWFPSLSIACIQPMYNLLKRQCESEILPMARDQGLGVLSYGPVAGGYLTGKYFNEDTKKNEQAIDARFKVNKAYQKRYEDQRYQEQGQGFVTFARDHNYHPASLAIAWAAANPDVTAPLVGARHTQQLQTALGSLAIDMTYELWHQIAHFSSPPAIATDRDEER